MLGVSHITQFPKVPPSVRKNAKISLVAIRYDIIIRCKIGAYVLHR